VASTFSKIAGELQRKFGRSQMEDESDIQRQVQKLGTQIKSVFKDTNV